MHKAHYVVRNGIVSSNTGNPRTSYRRLEKLHHVSCDCGWETRNCWSHKSAVAFFKRHSEDNTVANENRRVGPATAEQAARGIEWFGG